jgi:opine dehydrogenase
MARRSGYRASARVSTWARIEELLAIPTEPVANYLSVTLSNSNPLFHPARLYSVLRDWEPGDVLERTALFYEDWDDEATRVYIALDAEVLAVARALPGDLGHVRPILEHYRVADAAAMTRTIRALRALRDRWLPLVDTGAGWVPDLRSYYVTEDLPYGLVVVRAVGDVAGVPMPVTDRVLAWAERVTGKRWLDGGRVCGPDAAALPIPAMFGITDAASLVAAGLK